MDHYNLERFKRAQEYDYESALREILSGRKTGHWMWYVFPQMRGLGQSDMSDYFGIGSLDEAKAYLADPVLGARLAGISGALLGQQERDPMKIFGYPDGLKLRSCMTLFSEAGGESSVYRQVLDAFYHGEKDARTMALLERGRA